VRSVVRGLKLRILAFFPERFGETGFTAWSLGGLLVNSLCNALTVVLTELWLTVRQPSSPVRAQLTAI